MPKIKKEIKKKKSDKEKPKEEPIERRDKNEIKSDDVVNKVKKVLSDKQKTIKLKDFERQLDEIEVARNTNTTLDKIAEVQGVVPNVLSSVRAPVVEEDQPTEIKYLGNDQNKYRQKNAGTSSGNSEASAIITPVGHENPMYIPNMGRERQNNLTSNEFDLNNFQRHQRGFNEPMIDYIAKPERMKEHKPRSSGIARDEFQEKEEFLKKYNL